MLVGIVGGIYLSLNFSLVIGIPLLAGGIIVSFLSGGDGKSLYTRLYDSILKPSERITLGDGIRALIILAAEFSFVGSTANFTAISDLGFDAVQFGIVAFINMVLLAYLWTGVLKEKKEKEGENIVVTTTTPKLETQPKPEQTNINTTVPEHRTEMSRNQGGEFVEHAPAHYTQPRQTRITSSAPENIVKVRKN